MKQHKHYANFTGANCPDYILDTSNIKVVDLAIKLQKPILIEGEPGCGKTALAQAIADDLNIEKFHTIQIQSTSKAKDTLYRYNALARLQDSQSNDPKRQEKSLHSFNYINLEPLGEAIKTGTPSVILLDEVDKADIDFPDDLLHVLSTYSFNIDDIPADESKEAEKAKKNGHVVSGNTEGYKPIIIFTSNRKNPLSSAFLRRCIYLELNFPENPQDLSQIVKANLKKRKESGLVGLEEISDSLIESAIDSFIQLRKDGLDPDTANKAPATAELIDWIHVLHIEKCPSDSLTVNGLPRFWQFVVKSAEDKKLLLSN